MYTLKSGQIAARNIAHVRAETRLSQEQLADIIMEETGNHITPHMIGRYERAESRVDIPTLVSLAIGLDTSLQNLLDGVDPRDGEPPAVKRKINRLGQMEHKIYTDIAANWRGDTKALAIATACYCILPEEYRLSAIMAIMGELSAAIRDGKVSLSDLPDGLPYLQEQIGALSQKANG